MKIKDICLGVTDGSHNPPQGQESGDYLMLSSKNVFDGQITFDNPRYLSQTDFEQEKKRTEIKSGDVLLTIVGSVGRVAVVGANMPQFTLQRSVAVLHPNTEICSSRYLMYALRAKRNYIESRAKGVAQKGIYLKEVSEIELQIPLASEQISRVETLDGISSVIKSRQQQLQKLDELVKARFVEMFGNMVYNPNGWKKVNLGSVCDVRDGTHDSPKYFPVGYPLVTSKNVTSGRIDFTDCGLICKEDYDKINERSRVDFGDILMPMIGTVGKPVVVDIDADFAIKNVALIKFYEDSKVINTFVRALLQSDYFDRAVISKIRGGTQKFIALSDIRKLEFYLPPMDTQNQFAAFVGQTDKAKLVVQKALDETQLLFDSLMQKYFR